MNEVNEQYRLLIEDSPDGVAIIRDANILYVNNTMVKMMGARTKKDLIGKFTFDFIPEPYQQTTLEKSQKIDKRVPVGLFEIQLRQLNQKLLDVELKGHRTTFEGQQARYYIVRDITRKKEMEELLIHSEKLSVAGQLAAGIAHEVRNPLTAIKGFLQLLNKKDDSLPYSEVIFSEINRIELILNELLLLAKPQKAKFEQIDLKSVLHNVITLLETGAILKNINIKMDYDCDDLSVYADSNQLKQVFINFIKNAMEAMPNGGIIRVEVKKDQDNLIINTIDQGSGIPKEYLDKIGKPFFTTKEEGTGLGIMICKQIINHHQGTMNIESSPNGTTIQVRLPL